MDKQRLLRAAAETMEHAHAPYSHFRVGAAVLASSGKIYTGCNVENASYGLTNCAERTAVFTAIAAGETAFTAVAITASGETPPYPCGACRQVLSEFCSPDTPVHVAPSGQLEQAESFTLGSLLPHSFAEFDTKADS